MEKKYKHSDKENKKNAIGEREKPSNSKFKIHVGFCIDFKGKYLWSKPPRRIFCICFLIHNPNPPETALYINKEFTCSI